MKKQFSLLVLFLFICSGFGQNPLKPEAQDIWAGMIEIEQGIARRHNLHDIPGSIVVLIPENGKFNVQLLAKKVLLDKEKLPELKQEPTLLKSSVATKSQAASIGILKFISASMSYTDEIKYLVTETGYSSIVDNEIDWAAFNKRVTEIKNKYPNLPSGVQFGVVKVANIISLYYEDFKKVTRAAQIAGWGFNAGGKSLSEKGNSSLDFKIGVALTYPDLVINNLRSRLKEDPTKELTLWSTQLQLQTVPKDYFDKLVNISIAKNIARPGSYVEDIDDLIFKE